METFPIILSALILASANFIGILIPVKNYVPRKWWLSFSGGVAVAYVFVHLIPELHKITSVAGDSLTFSVTLLGTIIYFGAIKFVKESKSTPESRLAFITQMIILVPYFFTVGYFLERLSTLTALSSYTVAVGIHLVGFGYDQKEDHGEKYTIWVVGTLAVVLIAGTITSYFYKLDEFILSLLLAFVTGGILLNSIKEEIPTINQSRFWAFAAGASLTGILLLIGF
jgi:zinc transporter ZupT